MAASIVELVDIESRVSFEFNWVINSMVGGHPAVLIIIGQSSTDKSDVELDRLGKDITDSYPMLEVVDSRYQLGHPVIEFK